jgi:hypothetical protein
VKREAHRERGDLARRTVQAMLGMKKLDVEELRRTHDGEE